MTVSNTTSVAQFNGDGVARVFPFSFRIFKQTDLVVTKRSVAGVSSVLALNTDYTVTFSASKAGGSVSTTATPVSGELITVARVLPAQQLTDLRNQGDYFAEIHEDVFDYLTMLNQQNGEIVSRALVHPRDDDEYQAQGRRISNLADPVLPSDAATQGWSLNFITRLVESVTGVIGNTVGILYDGGNLFDFLKFGVGRTVTSIAGIRTLSSQRNQRAFALGWSSLGDGGGGAYYVDASDTTSADNGGTILVATDGARWKLKHAGEVGLEQFGAVGTGMHDDAMTRALAWAQVPNSTGEERNASLTFGAGKTLNLSQQFSIDTPISLVVNSMVMDYGTTGVCLTIAKNFSNRNTGWNIRFPVGARCVNGNTASPTKRDTTKRTFMEVRRMQFSELEIGKLIAFPCDGLYLNGSENVYTNQHIQQNRIKLGQVAYCGAGLKLLSNSAQTGGVQANRIEIQDIFQNFHNMDWDTDGYSNSTSNTVVVQAMDMHASGGYGLNCFASFNTFIFGFVESSLLFQASAFYNTVRIGNNQSSGVAISDVNNTNWLITAPPDLSQLPTSQGISLDTEYRNLFGVPVIAYFTANITATTSKPSGLSVKIGRNTASLVEVLKPEVGFSSSPAATSIPVSIILKHGDIFKISRTGEGLLSLSNVTYMQSST